MTSELRLLMPVPTACSRSSTMTSRPPRASACATARPTTPAPMTMQSTRSVTGQPVSAQQQLAGVESFRPARGRAGFDAAQPHQATEGIGGKPALGVLRAVTAEQNPDLALHLPRRQFEVGRRRGQVTLVFRNLI